MQSVIGFNHISSDLSDENVEMLKKLYYRYHEKMWCYKQAYKSFKKKDLVLTVTSTTITAGGLGGAAVFLPVIAVGICGIVLGVIAKKMNYSRKIELTRYAYSSYQKVLNKLRASLRGDSFDKRILIHELNELDDNVVDLCPAINIVRYGILYRKIYHIEKI